MIRPHGYLTVTTKCGPVVCVGVLCFLSSAPPPPSPSPSGPIPSPKKVEEFGVTAGISWPKR